VFLFCGCRECRNDKTLIEKANCGPPVSMAGLRISCKKMSERLLRLLRRRVKEFSFNRMELLHGIRELGREVYGKEVYCKMERGKVGLE